MDEYQSPLSALKPEHATKILRFCVEQCDNFGTWPGKQVISPAFEPERFEGLIRQMADTGEATEEALEELAAYTRATERSPIIRLPERSAGRYLAVVATSATAGDAVDTFHAATELLIAVDQKRTYEEAHELLFALVEK